MIDREGACRLVLGKRQYHDDGHPWNELRRENREWLIAQKVLVPTAIPGWYAVDQQRLDEVLGEEEGK